MTISGVHLRGRAKAVTLCRWCGWGAYKGKSCAYSATGCEPIRFDSKAEHRRFLHLRYNCPDIQELRVHPVLSLCTVALGNRELVHLGQMTLDFRYCTDEQRVLEDVKPHRNGKPVLTREFIWKWKHLKAQYPRYVFNIVEG